jgi:hypothetical protein
MPSFPAEIVHIVAAEKRIVGTIVLGKLRGFARNRNRFVTKDLCGTPS